MPVTVSDLIHSSFRLIGAIAAGEQLETYELNDALVSLNQMLSSWNTEGASVAGRKRMTMPVSNLTGIYLLPERPVHIESASVAISGIDSPVQIVDSVGWEAVPEKQALSVYVRTLFCDYAWPASTVYIWPVPRLPGLLELWIYQLIPQFTSLGQTVDLPQGYEMALRYNFAMALLPEYPRSQVDPTLPAQAQNFKASIVQLNRMNHMASVQSSPTQAAIADAAQSAAR
ncbi:MAG TPA: hypothetical protein VKD72_00420 [Gemmataceae bacterium]|nr:hypothetical protein [Gemmataceae bacterium]